MLKRVWSIMRWYSYWRKIDNIDTPFDFTFPTKLRDALAKNECFDVDMVLEGNGEMNLVPAL